MEKKHEQSTKNIPTDQDWKKIVIYLKKKKVFFSENQIPFFKIKLSLKIYNWQWYFYTEKWQNLHRNMVINVNLSKNIYLPGLNCFTKISTCLVTLKIIIATLKYKTKII